MNGPSKNDERNSKQASPDSAGDFLDNVSCPLSHTLDVTRRSKSDFFYFNVRFSVYLKLKREIDFLTNRYVFLTKIKS